MGKCDEASVEVNMGDSASPLKQDIFVFTVPPEAPVFTPTPEEFLDPLAYINKIRPIAEKSGICKIKPPQNWQPPFAVDVDRLKFTPRIQRLNELEAITRVKLNFLDQIVKFWELQGSMLKIPTVERKPLDIYSLHRIVKEAGGYDVCTAERKWSKIAVRMGHPQGKGVGTILKNHYERILFPYDLFKSAEALEVKVEKGEMTPEKANVTGGCKGRGSAQKGSPQPQPDVKPPTRRWKKHNSEPELEHEGSQTEGCMGAEGGDRKKDLRRTASATAKTPEVDDKKSILRESPSKRRMGGIGMASCPGSLRAPRPPPHPAPSLQDKRQVSMTVNVVPAAPDTRDGAVDPLAKYICHNCGRGDIEEQMLLCDGCDDSYHTFCLMPPLGDIPKGDWRCPPCITQEVSKPAEAFGFEQAQREYSLQQFGEMADQFKSEYFNMPVHLVPTQTVEKEFWRIVSSIDEDVTVEYGADLHSMDHGSGFPTKSSKHLYAGDQEYADSSWNLNNLPILEGSVLGHINADISGMKVPWMYVGMCFATFCWHNEDHWSYSINYMHWGEPKTWYGVPGSKAELFETTMRSAAPELFQWQPDLLHQLVTIMNPNTLMHAGVPVYRTDQNAGEFVITFPRAYHAGFNQGYNFAEAVNFTPADWLKIGRECISHYSNLRRFCVFSHDELVCKMSLEADSLEATVALATYQDMRTMLGHERKLRKGLLDWGVTEAEREAFELLPDDERQCSMCKTTCFLSAVTCSCTEHLVCLRHYTDLCQCPPHKHKLRYRYTLDELPLMLERLKRRSESFKEWADAVSNALSPNTPKSCDLEGLRSHLKKAADLKMQKSDLMRALEVAIEDAEKCVSVIHQLDLNKMRTRTRHSVDLKYRLTVEELTMFCEEIDNLACVLPEGSLIDILELNLPHHALDLILMENRSAVKEVLRQTLEIERTADALLVGEPGCPGGPTKIRELEACAEKGAALCIQLPKLPRIVNRLKQEKFLEEVKIHREGYEPMSVEVINRLLEQGLKIQPHCRLEVQLVYLQKLKNQVDVWEKKAQSILSADSEEKTLQETEALLLEAKDIEALLPSKQQLTVAVNQAKDWLKKVADMQSKDSYPYFSTLEAIVKKGSGIVINLYEKDMLVNALGSACQWKDRTAKTFFKKNWPHGLMETLSPRTDILSNNRRTTGTAGRVSSSASRGNSSPVSSTPEVDHFMKNFNEERSPTQIVAAFKSAEDREIANMRELRARNLRKDIRIPQPGVTYCLCQKRQFGLMTQCELCKEWFHSNCVNTRTSTGGSSPSPADSTSPDAEAPNSPTSNTLQQNNPSITSQSHSNASASSRFLCPSCLRTRRPRLEIILGLLVALQKLPVRLAEGEALQCLTERAMAWQDVARSLLATRDAARAMAALTHADHLVSQAAAREKTEKIISSELRKASRNPELQHRVHQLSVASGVGSPPDTDIHNRNSSASEHAYSASPQTLPRSPPLTAPLASAPARLRLSPHLLHRFEDLMMEGDLLEVSMVETNHLWSVVRAARGDGRSPCGVWNERANARPANSILAGSSNSATAAKRPGQGPLHRRHMKRPRRNKDGMHPVKVVNVKRNRKSPPPVANLNSTAPVPRRTNVPAPTATNYLNRKQGMQGVPGGGSLMMKKHYLAKQERRRRGMAPKAPHALTAQGKPSVRGRRGPHKLKKERVVNSGTGPGGAVSGSGESPSEGVRSGAGPHSPVSEDTSSGNMSSNDDEEDCAAHTCLRPTGKEVDWVQCDGGCEKWFHLHCVGLVKNSLKDDEDYYCDACSGVPEGTPRVRSQSMQEPSSKTALAEQTPVKNPKPSAADRHSGPTPRTASRDGNLILTCHEKMDKDEDSDDPVATASADLHSYRPKKTTGADKNKKNTGVLNGDSNGVTPKTKTDLASSNISDTSSGKRDCDGD